MGPGGGLFFLKSASLDPLSGPFSDPTFQEFCRPVVAHGPNTSKKNSKPRGASHVHQWILDDPICRGCSVARFRSMGQNACGFTVFGARADLCSGMEVTRSWLSGRRSPAAPVKSQDVSVKYAPGHSRSHVPGHQRKEHHSVNSVLPLLSGIKPEPLHKATTANNASSPP